MDVSRETGAPLDHSPVFMTAPQQSLGIQGASGIWSRQHTDPNLVYRRLSKTPRSFKIHRPAARTGTNSPASAATAPAPSGSPAPAACASTPSSSTRKNPNRILHRDFRRRRVFAPTTRAKTWKPHQQRPRLAIHSRSQRRSRPLRSPRPPCILGNPTPLFMQKHWDVMRSDNSGDLWHEVSGKPAHRFRLRNRRPRP